MIRRNLIRADSDQRVVKWALIAAALAFVLGSFAEVRIHQHVQNQAQPEVIQQAHAVAANPAG
jgi:hypothetical protein